MKDPERISDREWVTKRERGTGQDGFREDITLKLRTEASVDICLTDRYWKEGHSLQEKEHMQKHEHLSRFQMSKGH